MLKNERKKMVNGYIEEMGKKAKEASKKLLTLDTRTKNKDSYNDCRRAD